MASNSIGFAVILIAVILGSVAIIQALGLSINQITDAQSEQIERSLSVENQDINVTTENPNPNEFRLFVNNTGTNTVDSVKLTILFENTNASIINSFQFNGSTYTPDTVEINGDPVPENRTAIPPRKQLNVTYSVSGGSETPRQVRVFTQSGVGDTA